MEQEQAQGIGAGFAGFSRLEIIAFRQAGVWLLSTGLTAHSTLKFNSPYII